MRLWQAGDRVTAPDVEGDRPGTLLAVENDGTAYVHWDGDGPDVVGDAPIESLRAAS